jgi:hypothetical protein
MLLCADAGTANRYRVAGLAILDHRSYEPVDIISRPSVFSNRGRQFFRMMYGCVEWTIKVSVASHPTFDRHTLTTMGRMPIIGMDWREFETVQLAGAALRREAVF